MPVGSLKKLHTDHLQCRSWAHAWDYKVSYLERIDREECIELHLQCSRCKCERIDTYVRNSGRLRKRAYRWPDEYIITDINRWGGRRRFNANVRTELLGRYTKTSERKEKDGRLPVHGKRVRKTGR